MDHSLLVRRFERVGDLTRGCHDFRDRHRTALQAIGQGLAVNQLEHQALERRRHPRGHECAAMFG